MHVAEVLDQPKVTIAFDSNQDEARERRIKAYAEAEKEGYYVAGAHCHFGVEIEVAMAMPMTGYL